MQLYSTISGYMLFMYVSLNVNVHDCVLVYTFISTVCVNVCLCHWDNRWIDKQYGEFFNPL